jgi:hypothetical protein
MHLDPHNWSPLSVNELAAVFSAVPANWWVAGGVALDLFLGRTTRPHEDIDVQIVRRDQLTVQEHLSQWDLFRTKAPLPPHLETWARGDFLEAPVNSVWARRPGEDAWAFMIMLMEAQGDEWVYRRLPSIRGKIADLGRTTDDGVPYLAPEIQLLYKGRREVRPHDTLDLERVLPKLPQEKALWLLECLRMQYPRGHPWIPLLERRCARAGRCDRR